MSTTATATPVGTWNIDPSHSNVTFQVKHLGIATVRGAFTKFEGTLELAEDLSASRAYGTVEVASVDTNEDARDEHLRSADFFDAENYPKLTFESTEIKQVDDDELEITGDLTIHGVTNPITFTGRADRHRGGPVGQPAGGRRGRGQAGPQGLRHDLQPGPGQRQRAGVRQGQADPGHLRRQGGLAHRT